jgi:transposase-like protein
MHPPTTRSEFFRLRLQGLSLARIARQLGVSKPTLIAWSRQSQSEIESRAQEDHQRLKHELTDSADHELAALTRKLNALKQELFSRALRDIPTVHLETISGQLRQRIQELESFETASAICHPPPAITSQDAAPTGPHADPEPIRTFPNPEKNILHPENNGQIGKQTVNPPPPPP